MWRIYMNLLIMNNKFLFEEGSRRSKNFFCELLHSQIDVSNKLFMLVSRADEETFNSYVHFINDQTDLKEELSRSLFYSENMNNNHLNLSDVRPSYNKQFTVGTLQPYNYSSNLVSSALEFPKVLNKEGHFADLKKFLLDSVKEGDKDFSLGASLNFAETPNHNRPGNLSFLDIKSMKKNELFDSTNNFPFSVLNKSIPEPKVTINHIYEKRQEDHTKLYKANEDDKNDEASSHNFRWIAWAL